MCLQAASKAEDVKKVIAGALEIDQLTLGVINVS